MRAPCCDVLTAEVNDTCAASIIEGNYVVTAVRKAVEEEFLVFICTRTELDKLTRRMCDVELQNGEHNYYWDIMFLILDFQVSINQKELSFCDIRTPKQI